MINWEMAKWQNSLAYKRIWTFIDYKNCGHLLAIIFHTKYGWEGYIHPFTSKTQYYKPKRALNEVMKRIEVDLRYEEAKAKEKS